MLEPQSDASADDDDRLNTAVAIGGLNVLAQLRLIHKFVWVTEGSAGGSSRVAGHFDPDYIERVLDRAAAAVQRGEIRAPLDDSPLDRPSEAESQSVVDAARELVDLCLSAKPTGIVMILFGPDGAHLSCFGRAPDDAHDRLRALCRRFGPKRRQGMN